MVVTCCAAPALSQEGESSQEFLDFTLRSPAKVVTAGSCGECHALELDVWQETPHATGFKTLHRKESAEVISGRMGFRLIKRESLCLKCHYTAKVEKDQLRAVSGVSCESCHGAGRDWIDVHNDYGSGKEQATETADHKSQRIAASRKAGMRRPSEIYDTAKSCFECHTVYREEKLVNVGGHSTGSAGFELVERSQGDIRHNFLGSLTGGSRENRESSPERTRLLYLGGRLLDLEYSLRGMAKASMDGTYSKAMNRRVRNAVAEVRAIGTAIDSPQIDEIVGRVRGEKIVVGRSAALVDLADWIQEQNKTLLREGDQTLLTGLDPLIAGEAPADDELTELDPAEGSIADALSPGSATGGSTAAATGGDAAAASSQSGTGSRGGIAAVGETHRSLRPRSSHKTLGPGACSGCHGDQNAWWFDDPHFATADPFFNQDAKVVEIGRLYGIQPAALARGDSLCMNCHGSVESGKERREVIDGVGCEACHGPAADWLEPHKEGDAPLGRNRPGFIAALPLGKTDLESLSVRADTCSSCHYITDSRLLSSGHPSGNDYDFPKGVASIGHWSRPLEANGQLASAYSASLTRRGPIPTVRLARLPDGGTARGGASGPGESGVARGASERQARILAPRPRGRSGASTDSSTSTVEIDAESLPSFPTIGPETTVEDTILLLRQRLEFLYELIASPGGSP